MIRQGHNFRMVDASTAKALLGGLRMAADQHEQPAPIAPLAQAMADAGYTRHQADLNARKAARLGILPSELDAYRRIMRGETYRRSEAVAIILRSRRAQA